MKELFIIRTHGAEKEAEFSYPFARRAIIFFLTVLNGTLPVLMLFSEKTTLSFNFRLFFILLLFVFELLFFNIYFPLQRSLRINPKKNVLVVKTIGPFYMNSISVHKYSGKPFVTSSDAGPVIRFTEDRRENAVTLFPFASNQFVSSLPIFSKEIRKNELTVLAKELGVRTFK